MHPPTPSGCVLSACITHPACQSSRWHTERTPQDWAGLVGHRPHHRCRHLRPCCRHARVHRVRPCVLPTSLLWLVDWQREGWLPGARAVAMWPVQVGKGRTAAAAAERVVSRLVGLRTGCVWGGRYCCVQCRNTRSRACSRPHNKAVQLASAVAAWRGSATSCWLHIGVSYWPQTTISFSTQETVLCLCLRWLACWPLNKLF